MTLFQALDTDTIPVITDPPIGEIPNLAGVAVVVVAIVVAIYYFWDWLVKRQEITHADIAPTLSDMDSVGVSINMASLVQMIMVLPALGAFIWAAMSLDDDPVLSGAIAAAVIAFQFALIAEMRRRTREKNSGMKVLTGPMRTKDGTKRSYRWRRVEIMTPRRLPDADYELISQATGGEWDKKRFDKHLIYPTIIDNRHTCFLVMSAPESEALEWTKNYDWDYFGDYEIQECGPELHEMATVHRVTNDYSEDEDETYFQRDEWIRVFSVVWDDKKSVDFRNANPHIDVTREDVIGQISVAIGVQGKITAGMLNADRETLMNVLNDQRKLQVMAQAIGSGLAAGIIEDNEALGTLDKLGEGIDWMQIIVYAVIFFFGWVLGNSGMIGG